MIVGVTGSFGSGKTTIAKMFEFLGAYVIDVDSVCHSLMEPKRKVYKRIVRYFGTEILGTDRRIKRSLLAEIVFREKSKLKLLNRLIHPEAIREVNKIIKAKKKKKIIVVDAALLVETGFYKRMDKLIVVKANRKKQVERLLRSKGEKRRGVLQRIGMQAPLKEKLVCADFIIDNSGLRRETRVRVEKIWQNLRGDVCQ